MLTSEIMQRMWPNGDTKIPGLLDGIVAAAPAVFLRYGLNSDLVIAHAMAQFSHECGAGLEVVENLNYSAAGLQQTWPSRFNATKAAEFAHKPQAIANEVYNGRMGNRAGTDDGWNYRGRGGSQLTGRQAYTDLGTGLGIDLVGNPDLVNDANRFLEVAVADFILCGCLPFAQADDLSGVTFHLNGGHIGEAQRKAWLSRWKLELGSAGAPVTGTVWIQQSLNKLGAEPALVADGSFGPLTAAALKAFQAKLALDQTGKADPKTIAAINQELAKLPS